MKRTRINPRSAKRAAFARERRQFVDDVLEERPFCEVGPELWRITGGAAGHDLRRPSVDVHERLTRARSGQRLGTYVDPDNVLALCRRCHDWIGEHPAVSEQMGWLVRSDGSTSKTLPRGYP